MTRHADNVRLRRRSQRPRVVMEILGHSQIALTMSTYTHVVPDLRKDAAARLESLFGERER